MHKQSILALAVALCTAFAVAAPSPGRSTDLNAQGNSDNKPPEYIEEFKEDDYSKEDEYNDLRSENPPTNPRIRDRLQKKIASDVEKTILRIKRDMGETQELKGKLEKAKVDSSPADSIMHQLLSIEYTVEDLRQEIAKGVFRPNAQLQLHQIVEEHESLDKMLYLLEVGDINDQLANLENPGEFKKETIEYLQRICKGRQESWDDLKDMVNRLSKYNLRFSKEERESIPEMAAQCQAEILQLHEDCAQIEDINHGADIFQVKRRVQVQAVRASQQRWDKMWKRFLELQKKGERRD